MSNGTSFHIPDPDNIIKTKYTFGDITIRIPEIESYTPVFAYDLISLDKNEFCFNFPEITVEDYRKYFEAVKYISIKTITELMKESHDLHFHILEMDRCYRFISWFKKRFKIDKKIDVWNMPPIGQFGLYTDNELQKNGKAPRIYFILGPYGVFHLFRFDLKHKTFKKD